MSAADLRKTVVDGVPVRWLEAGEGHPVVLVHGIPTSPRLWRHVLPLVRGRCLAFEMTGYGTSIPDGEGRDLGLAAQAERLLRWLDVLGVEAPVLVGHDLGGGVAQIAAARRPDAFGGLVLTNAVCYDSWPIPSVSAMQRTAGVLRHLPATALYPTFVQLIHRGHDQRERALESIGIHWQPYVTHGAAAALMRQVSALRTRDTLAVADRLPSLSLPARVVWGEADRFQKVHYGRRLAADLGTTLQTVPGGGHFTPEDHPDRIAAAINDLLPGRRGRTVVSSKPCGGFAAYPMVEEAQAIGVVAGVYAALLDRMPFVPSLFKSLAVCPGYLVLAAEQAIPALADPAFGALAERLASSVRTAAAPPPDGEVCSALAGFIEPLSRMLLLAAGLRLALEGALDAPPAPGRAPEPRPVRPAGPAPSPEDAPAPELYGDIRAALQTPIVNSIWRSLAGRWLLQPAWAALRPQVAATRPAATALQHRAIEAAREEVPWAVAATPRGLEEAGLGDAATGMASILDAYLTTLPRVLVLVACTADTGVLPGPAPSTDDPQEPR